MANTTTTGGSLTGSLATTSAILKEQPKLNLTQAQQEELAAQRLAMPLSAAEVKRRTEHESVLAQQYVKGVPGNCEENPAADTGTVIKTKLSNTDESLLFRVPDWGYQDFLRERASWQKGFDSATGEPGWFYFKIFFRFDTGYGLLGGLLNEETENSGDITAEPFSYDSAVRYLTMNINHYSKMDIDSRISALYKFASILSFINGHAPWFFNSIGGLDKATVRDFKEPFKDNIINLGFMEDAVDMRVTSLIDLYKYAAFDYINLKEVLPENLRQFDMTVVLFHTPIRWYHTGMQTMRRGTFQYKSLGADDMNDRMSYKMYTFKGCEFVHESLANVYPSEMSNADAFNLGNAKIDIKYKRVYQHSFNEWGRFLVGDDGVYWNNPTGTPRRLAAITDAKENPYYFNPGAEIFKPLVDATESRITWMMKQLDPSGVFGNLYLDNTDVYGKKYQDKLNKFKAGAESLQVARVRLSEDANYQASVAKFARGSALRKEDTTLSGEEETQKSAKGEFKANQPNTLMNSRVANIKFGTDRGMLT